MLKPPLRVRAQSCPLLYTPVSCALVVLTCLAQYLVRPKRRQTDKINAGTPTNRSLYSPRFEMFYSQRNKATVTRFVEGYSNILQLFYKMEGVLIHITLWRSYIANKKNNDGIGWGVVDGTVVLYKALRPADGFQRPPRSLTSNST